MPVPATNFDPPFNITRASHLTFTVRDLLRSRDFYVDVLGLLVTGEDANVVYLRGIEEQCHHSLTLKRTTGAPVCERIGFRMFTEADIERAKHHFDKAGIPARWADIPFQSRTLHVTDPAGTPLEFCASMPVLPRRHTKAHLHKGGRALRLDHYQVLVPNVVELAAFYTGLGFRISDYLCIDETDNPVGVFLHRKDNPWDIVFLQRPGPRFHHVGYVVESMHDMIEACNVAGNLGLANLIEHGPGRHGHQHSYFTYLRDPDGHRSELLLPPIQIIDIEDGPQRFTVKPGTNSNLWGLPAPGTWVNEATAFG